MDKKLEKAFNDQIQKELYSAYLYLSMAAYFEALSLPGFSHWMQIQEAEERIHAMKIFQFMNDRGSRVILEAIGQPPADFESMHDVFEKTLEHEKLVTASINDLYALAVSVNDNAAVMFLQWFVTEQVEEEKNANDILTKLDFIKTDSAGVLMLDKELSARPLPTAAEAA